MTIENGKHYELGKRTFIFIIISRVATSIVLVVVAILLGIISAVVVPSFDFIPELAGLISTAMVAIVIFALLLGLIGFGLAFLEYRFSRVMLDSSSLRVVKGILHKREVAIPYRRIQSVEINQSLLYRIVRIARVEISTTTDLDEPGEKAHEDDEEIIPLMDYELAQAVTNELTKRAEVERMHITSHPSGTV